MSGITISQTQDTLLKLLSGALTGKQFDIPADTDWAALFKESKAQAVAPMVFSCVSEQCADKEVFLKWKHFTMRAIQNNMNVHLQHHVIHQILTEHDIPYCIIKGGASAKDYPDPLLRAMGDVDFLMPDDYWEKATQVLCDAGFETSGEDHQFHLSFHKNNFDMEMHHDPFGLKKNGEKLQELIPEFVEKRVLFDCETGAFYMPDDFGHGIIMLIHAYRHLITSGIGVRHLCDWAMFISHFSDEEFRSIFEERFSQLGIWKLAQCFALAAHLYLNIPYQPWMGQAKVQAHLLMMDILDGGNFGRNNQERGAQNLTIFDDNMKVAKGSGRKEIFRGLNRAAYARYPWMERNALLRPFGWIAVGFRYVGRVLTGKRKAINMKETTQIANVRKELYQGLCVFDEESSS